jgi:RimJ/RimL family protein N-acetyltransferase
MKTERLILRHFQPEDFQDLHAYLSQAEVVKYEPYEVFDENASRLEAQKRANNPAFWAICLQARGKVIGNVYLAENSYDTWELGYVLNLDYQKKGYAFEATQALLTYVFQEKQAHRVVAYCNPENRASWQLLERLGMRREGELQQNVWFKKDENDQAIWQDTYEYALLSRERLEKMVI